MDTQLKKGVLELCVLHQLKKGEMYGYEIMKIITDQFPEVYDGTIYSILRRLNKDGYTRAYFRDSPNGPRRKYFYITDEGNTYLATISREWDSIVRKVANLGIGKQ
jgi:PadR family transcriptional regulator PadR